MRKFKWTPKLVAIDKIKPSPVNYKIKNELGKERLSISLGLFGNASTVTVNTDMCLIDGNSRLEDEKAEGTKKMWVMMPDRKLTPKLYKEMCAMFDRAAAGEVDIERIREDLGTSKDFYDRWKEEIPLHMLDKLNNLGKNAKAPKMKEMAYPDPKDNGGTPSASNVAMVNLFFSIEQEKKFRIKEEKLMKKFKTKNTTDTVFKAIMSFK